MTAEQVIGHLETQDKQVEAVTKFWVSVLPTVALPSLSLMKSWLKQFDLETVCYGLSEAGLKNQKVGDMTTEDVVRFAGKCQIGYAARDPRRKTFRLSDQKPPRKRIQDDQTIVAYLSKNLADLLGDVPAETPLTEAQLFRVFMRLADIRAGKVHRPTPATPTATQEGQLPRSKAA